MNYKIFPPKKDHTFWARVVGILAGFLGIYITIRALGSASTREMATAFSGFFISQIVVAFFEWYKKRKATK